MLIRIFMSFVIHLSFSCYVIKYLNILTLSTYCFSKTKISFYIFALYGFFQIATKISNKIRFFYIIKKTSTYKVLPKFYSLCEFVLCTLFFFTRGDKTRFWKSPLFFTVTFINITFKRKLSMYYIVLFYL